MADFWGNTTSSAHKPSKPHKAWTPSAQQIYSYLRSHHLTHTKANIARATKALISHHTTNPQAKNVTVHEATADWQIIYGRMQVGGTITYFDVSADHTKLYLVITIAGHEIDALESIYVDDTKISFHDSSFGWATGPNLGSGVDFTNKIYVQFNSGTAGQSAFSQLVTDSGGKWVSTDKQSGRAGVYMKFIWDGTTFPNGLPQVYFQVRGKKPYDPRTGLSVWTANAALCIADYLMDQNYGGREDLAHIDTASLHAAADICDVLITNADGSVEQQYNVNGALTAKEKPIDVITNMCSAMGGSVTYCEGKWRFWPAVWRPPTIELTDADLLSPLTVQTLQSRQQKFNSVRATYTSAVHNFEIVDMPVVNNALYLSEDGGEESVHDLSLPFTVTAPCAQRLGKIELERVRQEIEVQGTFTLKAYQAQPPETVMLTLSRFGLTQKIFEVVDSSLVLENQGAGPFFACTMKLRETAEGIYEWNNGMETTVDLAPNTNLPSPFEVFDPTNLQLFSGTAVLFVRADGTVFSGIKLTWTPPVDGFVTSGGTIEIQYKGTSWLNWWNAPSVPGDETEAFILNVQDGFLYDVRIRAVNAFGQPGNWVEVDNFLAVGKSQPPSDVQGFTAGVEPYGILFSWQAIPDLDADLYELREGASWDTATSIGQTAGTTFRLNFRTAGSTMFLIKAIDTSGNYSLNATPINIGITAPSAPLTTFTLEGPDLLLMWEDSMALFAIDYYEVLQGPDFDTAAVIGTTKGTTFRKRVNWGGTQDFWVSAVDVAGNVGDPFHLTVTIVSPGAPDELLADVVDNHVFLSWIPPVAGNLPIAGYSVFKGDSYPPVDGKIGDVTGTFEDVMESAAGVYTYWVAAFDTAGNLGTPASLTTSVRAPPDFVLLTDRGVDPRDASVASNIYIEGFGYLVIAAEGGSGTPLGLLLAITSSGSGGGGSGGGSPLGLLVSITG